MVTLAPPPPPVGAEFTQPLPLYVRTSLVDGAVMVTSEILLSATVVKYPAPE